MYSAVLNPQAEKYKCVSLERSGSLPVRLAHNHHFYVNPDDNSEVIAPPRIVDEAIRVGSRLGDYTITDVRDPDPTEYPEYIALRIRGEVPEAVIYADKVTTFDLRVHQSANTILLTEDYPHPENVHEKVNEDSPFIPGSPAPIEITQEMGTTPLIDLSQGPTKYFIGYRKLMSLGVEFEEQFEYTRVKYGGRFFIPDKRNPHGTFDLSTIYIYMDQYNQSVVKKAEEEFRNTQDDKHSADEFDVIKASKKDNYLVDYDVIRAWWD